ncbi:hypothetical protein QWA68_016462 [Fusarium oxysporum]|nr:hypothetical protein QWA68_016462 [Fusarium oxysporum]
MTRSCLARFHILEAIVNHLRSTTPLTSRPLETPTFGDEVAVTHYFIESQTGKNFHIRYRFSPLFTFSDGVVAIILKFFIDGIECQQLVMNHEDLIGARDKIQNMCYRRMEMGDGRSDSYSLTFSEIAPVELAKRATVVSDIERIKTLKTIKVMIGFGKTCPGSGYP